jgi:hypothetical protein
MTDLTAEEEDLLAQDQLGGPSTPLLEAPPVAHGDGWDELTLQHEDSLIRERTARALALLDEDRAEVKQLMQAGDDDDDDFDAWRAANARSLARQLAEADDGRTSTSAGPTADAGAAGSISDRVFITQVASPQRDGAARASEVDALVASALEGRGSQQAAAEREAARQVAAEREVARNEKESRDALQSLWSSREEERQRMLAELAACSPSSSPDARATSNAAPAACAGAQSAVCNAPSCGRPAAASKPPAGPSGAGGWLRPASASAPDPLPPSSSCASGSARGAGGPQPRSVAAPFGPMRATRDRLPPPPRSADGRAGAQRRPLGGSGAAFSSSGSFSASSLMQPAQPPMQKTLSEQEAAQKKMVSDMVSSRKVLNRPSSRGRAVSR